MNVPIRAKEVVKLHDGGANGNHNDNMIGNIKVNTSKNKIAAPPAVASSTKQKEEGNILLVADNKKTNPIERICKERLSNREYFQAWDKFDVEAAEEALDSSTSSNGEDDDDDDLVLLKLNSDNNHYENDANKSNITRKVTVIREEETYNDDGLTTFCEKLNLQSLSPEERKFMATREREKGNECYRIQQYETAIDHYSKSIVLYNENAVVYANRAMACIRHGKNLDRALDDCNRALDLDPGYTKALARRGKIYQINGRYHDALRDFADCVRKEPGNEEYEKLWMQAKEKYGPDDEDDYDEQSKKRIVIIEDDEEEDGTCSVSEEEDILEEIYTPGCMTKK
jgi:tetratricopeptide (TPR) repeat protein